MIFMTRLARGALRATTVAAALVSGTVVAQELKITLSGTQEIPPVTTTGTGTAVVAVAADRSLAGSLAVSGMAPTVAHIHEAAAGSNGPIVVPLTKTGDNTWAVPAGIKLTPSQYESFKAGNLYFNVHSEAYRGGEIRGQIKP
jgi:hypothetical protein